MPGWYVHMEAAHETAERLRSGSLPPGFPLSAVEAVELGEICHTWRNYLALGALGPDLFYLLPDVPFIHDLDPITVLIISAVGIVVIIGLRALADYYSTVFFAIMAHVFVEPLKPLLKQALSGLLTRRAVIAGEEQ